MFTSVFLSVQWLRWLLIAMGICTIFISCVHYCHYCKLICPTIMLHWRSFLQTKLNSHRLQFPLNHDSREGESWILFKYILGYTVNSLQITMSFLKSMQSNAPRWLCLYNPYLDCLLQLNRFMVCCYTWIWRSFSRNHATCLLFSILYWPRLWPYVSA